MRTTTAVLALTAIAASAHAQTFWNEPLDGDLSGDRLNPTAVTLAQGDNRLIGFTELDDLDYLTLTIPDGLILRKIILESYASNDGAAFMGVQVGPTFTVDANQAEAIDMYGYVLFGDGAGNVGSDLLAPMGAAFGAQGFTPPLPAGTYTFWIQQIGDPTNYTMNFQVAVPAPGPAAAILAGLACLHRRRR